jgi:hypothetical protein
VLVVDRDLRVVRRGVKHLLEGAALRGDGVGAPRVRDLGRDVVAKRAGEGIPRVDLL